MVPVLPKPDGAYIYWPTFTLSIQERQMISGGRRSQGPLRTMGITGLISSIVAVSAPRLPSTTKTRGNWSIVLTVIFMLIEILLISWLAS